MSQIFDFGDTKRHEETLYKTWDEFRNALSTGLFEYDDIDAALNTTFLKTFNDMFFINNQKKLFTIRFDEIVKRGLYMERGGVLGDNEDVSYDRFIPNSAYIKEDNRFSPPGVEWLYIALGGDISNAKECAKSECRAKKGNQFAVCGFEIKPQHYNRLLVDLTISNELNYEDIYGSLEDFGQTVMRESVRRFFQGKSIKLDKSAIKEILADWMTFLYAKILSNSIFEPVDSYDKRKMYSPFQCMAKYFERCGFDGIIYGSTVYPKAKNMVLFDKEYAKPIGDIDIITV